VEARPEGFQEVSVLVKIFPKAGVAIEIALDVAPEVLEALDPNGPGGIRITRDEAEGIAHKIVEELVERVGHSSAPSPAPKTRKPRARRS
jgi:hypothetical protein